MSILLSVESNGYQEVFGNLRFLLYFSYGIYFQTLFYIFIEFKKCNLSANTDRIYLDEFNLFTTLC